MGKIQRWYPTLYVVMKLELGRFYRIRCILPTKLSFYAINLASPLKQRTSKYERFRGSKVLKIIL